MTQQGFDAKQLIAAIQADPGKAGEALAKNPTATQMLAEALGILGEYSKANVQNASATLPDAFESLPATQVSPLRKNFDEISVKVAINRWDYDVGVPNEMFDQSQEKQWTLAQEIGGKMAIREESEAVLEYLLDREACYLLAQRKSNEITPEESALLDLHRAKWTKEDLLGDMRALHAGIITDKEAALLEIYRTKWVRDRDGSIGVDGVRFRKTSHFADHARPHVGALVVRPSSISK
jgi:hypothetical protein